MQEIRRFFERVGAMGDDDAANLGPVQLRLHRTCQKLPSRKVHVLAVELGELMRLQLARCQTRYCREQIFDPQLRGRIADAVGGALRRAGDRAAGSQDDN